MSKDEDDDSKQHEASQRKLEKARKEGNIAKSQDLNVAASYLGLLITLYFFGQFMADEFNSLALTVFTQLSELSKLIVSKSAGPTMASIIHRVAYLSSGILAIPAILVILSIISQRSLTFTPSKLKFKLSRINPIENAKNKYGLSGIFEFLKSSSKLIIFSVALISLIYTKSDQVLTAALMTPKQIASSLGVFSVNFLKIVVVVSAIIGILDYGFQYAEHMKKNRMSHKELKDEGKESEGDPMLKQRRRQKAIEIANSTMLSDVANASVVVVNPTHFAVALLWDNNQVGAPVCVAKGVDDFALKIREIAKENGVPIHSDPPTARALHATTDVGQEIQTEHYVPVAAAIRFAEGVKSASTHSYIGKNRVSSGPQNEQ
jgi:flagellar biosynthetic protein FlhB